MDNSKRITNWINNVLTELSYLDNNKGIEILNQCGKDCCKSSELYQGAVSVREKYRNEKDDDKLFNEFKSKFYNSERLTKKGETITLVFEECTCPMVRSGVDNSFLCNCTIGYSKKIFETLFEKKVIVHLEKTILRGNSVCEQHIKILRRNKL